jgi:hypothetical protein
MRAEAVPSSIDQFRVVAEWDGCGFEIDSIHDVENFFKGHPEKTFNITKQL